MDRITFGKKCLNTQRPRVDRFIPPRSSFPEFQRSLTWQPTDDQREIWYAKYLRQKKYAKYLDEVFDLEQEDPRDEKSIPAWPCAPRKKKYLSSADSILDLPTYSYAPFPELLDWSNDNILVAALGTKYHKWSWRTQSLISQGFSRNQILCCKFDPLGELLALGTDTNVVEIHNNMLSKMEAVASCRCIMDDVLCSITALDWSPTGKSFVTGCSRGVVTAHLRNGQRTSWKSVIRGAILSVRISPDTRYVATAAVNECDVMILTWPRLERNSNLEITDWTVKSIAWHPWRSALLGIGAATSELHAHMAVWDIPSGRFLETALGRKHHRLDAMLFSRRTGELVVSLWNMDRPVTPTRACSELVVISGRLSVVDQWGEGRTGLDRVRTMVFSPDGTKLATATADEDLIIWNFLPEDRKKKKKTQLRSYSAIPVYLDKIVDGVSFR